MSSNPLASKELLARIRAALRRYAPGDTLPPFISKDLSLDFESRQLIVRGEEVHLTPKEFDVLKHLIANQGKPLTHRRLLQSVWGPDYGEETENLRVVINQLRKKNRKRSRAAEVYPDGAVGRVSFSTAAHNAL